MSNFNKNLLSQEINLVCKKDTSTGEFGYMVEGVPFINYPMATQEGFSIAHDLLEHVNGVESIGSIDDEIEALGGVWFVRGQHGRLENTGKPRYVPEEHLSSDISNMARIYNGGVEFKTPVPETEEHELDCVWEAIIQLGRRDITFEMDKEEIDQERLDHYFDACLHYMRTGYDKAALRFNDDSWAANQLFWAIAEGADPYVRCAGPEGQDLVLSFDIDTMLVRCLGSGKIHYVVVTAYSEEGGTVRFNVYTDEYHYFHDEYELGCLLDQNLNHKGSERKDSNGNCMVESIMDAINNGEHDLELPTTDTGNYKITFEYKSEYFE